MFFISKFLAKSIKYLIIFLIFSIPILISTSCYDTTKIKTLIFELSSIWLFLLWLGRNFLIDKFLALKEIKYPILFSLIFYFLWGTLSYFWGEYKFATIEKELLNICFFIFILVFITNKEIKIEEVNNTFLFAALFVFSYGIIQLLGLDWLKWDNRYLNLGRIYSTLANPSHFAVFSYVCFFISLACFNDSSSFWKKSIYSFFISVSVVSLYLTKSRIGIIGFLIGIISLYILRKNSKKQIFILGLFILILSVVFLIYRQQSFHYRIIVWKSTLKMIAKRPFFGWGLGNFAYIFPRFRNPLVFLIQKDHQIEIIHPENKYLLLLVEGGIIYLISFLLLLFFIFKGVLTHRRNSDSFSYSPYYLAGVIAMLSHNLFDTNLYFIFPRFIFWLLLGLLMVELKGKNPKEMRGINLNPNIYFPFLIFFFLFTILLSSFFYKIYCGDRMLKKAIYFSQLKKLDIAEEKYLKSIKENPYNPLSYYLLANLYQEREEKGDFQRSLLFYKRVEKIAGNYLQLYLFRGFLYNKLGKEKQARYWLNLAFFYDPYLKEKFQHVLNY